jgi:ribosomal protein L30/L7E
MNKELKTIVTGVKQNTATTYKNAYKRLRDSLGITDNTRKTVRSFGIDKIEPILLSHDTNSNARAGMLTVIKKLFDDKERLASIDDKIRKQKRELQITKNSKLSESLPSYKELTTALKQTTDPRKYIINFLFIHANTRNADVALIDLHRSNDSRTVDIDKLDKTRNHIILQDGYALFIRHVYKTSKTYGTKTNKITAKMFIQKAREYLGDENDKPLLTKKNGEAIDHSSFGAYLKRFRLLNLTEGDIMKIMLKHISSKGSSGYNLLRVVSKNRGTSIQTLLAEYDLSNIKEASNIVKGDTEVESES